MTRRERVRRLRALYARMPTVKCRGLCSECCGPIQCSDLEYDLIEARAGKKLTADRTLTCSMLSPNGRCTVYGDRPMICRMWGAVPKMPCPHGCEVENPITDDEGMELMLEVFHLGGGRRARLEIGELADALERMRSREGQQIIDGLLAKGRAGDRRKLLGH